MRFSLRTLLLMFPAFLLAWIGAAFIDELSRGMGHPKWVQEQQRLRMMHSAGSMMGAVTGQPVDLDKVNAWLAGNIPYNSPGYREFAEVLPPYRMNDLHDQPYQCVALDQNQQPVPAAKSATRVGFYSLGKDRKSISHGLDPDDLNSWEVEIHDYHFEQSYNQYLINVLAIVPYTLTFVLILGWKLLGQRKAPVQAQGESGDAV